MKTLDSRLKVPDKKSSWQVWVNWYDTMNNYFGPKDAKSAFLKAWQIRKSSDANTSQLRDAMKERGIKLDADSWGGSILDVGNDFADGAKSFFKFGSTIGMIWMAVVAIIFVVVAIKVIKLINQDTVGSVAKVYAR